MKIYGEVIKSWIYQKSLFFLIKTKKYEKPIIINARDCKNYDINRSGYFTANIDYNSFKRSLGSSKSYFGNKEALAESETQYPIDHPLYNDVNQGNPDPDSDYGFDDYDPLNEDSYLPAPYEDMELIGFENGQFVVRPDIEGFPPEDIPEAPDPNYPYDFSNPQPVKVNDPFSYDKLPVSETPTEKPIPVYDSRTLVTNPEHYGSFADPNKIESRG